MLSEAKSAEAESEGGEEESKKKIKSKSLWWIFILVLILILGVLGYFWWQFYFDKSLEPTPITIPPKSEETEEETEATKTAQAKCPATWEVYTNSSVGYKLCYPSDWTLKETDEISETIGMHVKFVTIDTPDNKYFLLFGVKKLTDDFRTNDRTGVGQGDLVPKPERAFELLGVTVTPEALVDQNRIIEYFYNQPEGTSGQCNCEFQAFFSSSVDYPESETINMTNLEYVTTAEKILKSVEWTS